MRFSSVVTAIAATLLMSACGPPQHQESSQTSETTTTVSQAGGAAATPSPATTAPVFQPTPTPTAAESGSALPSPSPAAKRSPAVSPSPTPTPGTNDPPQIIAMHIDKTVVSSGDTVSGSIDTTLNTASVEARIATYSISVPKVGAGRFALSYTVPDLPFFLKKTYDMVVIARNTAGTQTRRTVPITIR